MNTPPIVPSSLLIPLTGTKAAALMDDIRHGRVVIEEMTIPVRFLVERGSRQLLGAELKHSSGILLPQITKVPISNIEFFTDGPPYRIAINGRAENLNPLPFSVLFCILARFKSHGIHKWPEAHELVNKCRPIRDKFDPQERDWTSERNLKNVWIDWVHQTRKEIRTTFPDISEYDLIPDGKTSRRSGQHPRLGTDCVISGVDKALWLDGK